MSTNRDKQAGRRAAVRRTLVVGVSAATALALAPLTNANASVGSTLGRVDSPTTRSFDWFGQSVAASGQTVVVGDPAAVGGGAAYVYQLNSSGQLVLQQTLTEPAAAQSTSVQFGRAVAIEGNTIVVGDPYAAFGTYPNVFEPGLAFVFTGTTNPTTGVSSNFQFTTEDLAAANPFTGGTAFGFSISISNGTIIVGAPEYPNASGKKVGAAFQYTLSSTGYSSIPTRTFQPADGLDGDEYGLSVSGGSNTVVIGSPHHGATGAAYVIGKQSNGGWVQTGEVAGPAGSGAFGAGVTVVPTSNAVLVGAPATGAASGYPGAVYSLGLNILHRWSVSSHLTVPAGVSFFGDALASTKNLLVVGAPSGVTPGVAGHVVVYKPGLVNWQLVTSVAEPNPSANPSADEFGQAVAITGTTVVAGAYQRNAVGSVYTIQG